MDYSVPAINPFRFHQPPCKRSPDQYTVYKHSILIYTMLSDVINSGQVWQLTTGSGSTPMLAGSALDTGFPALNQRLAWGGWPQGLSEIVCAGQGRGEFSLLLPALAQVSQKRCVACLGLPHEIYAPALPSMLNQSNLLLLHPPAKDELWAAEQALRSDCCGALVLWPRKPLSFTQYRRLQILCAQHKVTGFIVLPSERQNTPSRLRIHVTRQSHRVLNLQLLKHPGTISEQRLQLTLPNSVHIRYPIQSTQGSVHHLEH